MKERCNCCNKELIYSEEHSGNTIVCNKCNSEYIIYSELHDNLQLETYLIML